MEILPVTPDSGTCPKADVLSRRVCVLTVWRWRKEIMCTHRSHYSSMSERWKIWSLKSGKRWQCHATFFLSVSYRCRVPVSSHHHHNLSVINLWMHTLDKVIVWVWERDGRQSLEEYKEVEEGDEEGKQTGGGRIKKLLRECTCGLCCKVHVNEISEIITQFSHSRGFSRTLWSKAISGCVPAWTVCLFIYFLF